MNSEHHKNNPTQIKGKQVSQHVWDEPHTESIKMREKLYLFAGSETKQSFRCLCWSQKRWSRVSDVLFWCYTQDGHHLKQTKLSSTKKMRILIEILECLQGNVSLRVELEVILIRWLDWSLSAKVLWSNWGCKVYFQSRFGGVWPFMWIRIFSDPTWYWVNEGGVLGTGRQTPPYLGGKTPPSLTAMTRFILCSRIQYTSHAL